MKKPLNGEIYNHFFFFLLKITSEILNGQYLIKAK